MENQPPQPPNVFHEQIMQQFWEEKKHAMEHMSDFKAQFPLARIRHIMKLDDEVTAIANETTHLFAKACELFIEELTLRSWQYSVDQNRCTLRLADISKAVATNETYDFLIDTVPQIGGHASVLECHIAPRPSEQQQEHQHGASELI